MFRPLNIKNVGLNVRCIECPDCGGISYDVESFEKGCEWLLEELLEHGALNVSLQLLFVNPEWRDGDLSVDRWSYNMGMHNKHFGIVEQSDVSD